MLNTDVAGRTSTRTKKAPEDPVDALAREAIAAAMRSEFWGAPPEAQFPRETIAAVRHLTVQALEVEAMRGGGVPYRRLGRRAFYTKSDYLAWVEAQGPIVRSTAQLALVSTDK